MRFLTLFLLLLLGILSVSQWHSLSEALVRQPIIQQETMAELPIISSSDDLYSLPSNLATNSEGGQIVSENGGFLIDDEAGQKIRVIGEYQQIDIRRRPTPPVQYRGNAIVILDDGGFISLYPMWHPDAIRPKDEIERFEGRRVIITGRAVSVAHPPDARGGRIDPSFLSVDSIELAPLEEFNSQENEG